MKSQMKINKLFPLFAFLILFSCQKISDKSIIEPLEVKEVSSLISQDAIYEDVIRDIERGREKLDKDIVLKTKFQKLTYVDYYEYHKIVNSNSFSESIEKQVYSDLDLYADSIMQLYKKGIDEKYQDLKIKYQKFEYNKSNLYESIYMKELFWGVGATGPFYTPIPTEYRNAIENDLPLTKLDYVRIAEQEQRIEYRYDNLLSAWMTFVDSRERGKINNLAYEFEKLIKY